MRTAWVVVAALVLVWAEAGSAGEFYAGPDGAPEGDGSRAKPLDLATALGKKSPARPGDTVRLLPGVYTGKRKADGLNIEPWTAELEGTEEKPIRVAPASEDEPPLLNGVLALNCSYVHFMDLEIGNPQWDPAYDVKTHTGPTAVNALGGVGTKVINCNIFGAAMAMGLWMPAREMEVYGNLIHDYGYANRIGHLVHSIYTQNIQGTKFIHNNIAWRGSAFHLHAYGAEGEIQGYDVRHNIFFIPGVVQKTGQTYDNFLVCAKKPADRIVLVGNVGYNPLDVTAYRANMRLGCYSYAQNGVGVVKDNYLAGAFNGLSLGDWRKVEVTGNTIWATGVLVEISSGVVGSGLNGAKERPKLANYTVDNNSYYPNGKDKPFKYGVGEKATDEDMHDFAGWQKLGVDRNSRMLPGKDGRPTGTRVFVFPNKYRAGRANAAVFNWDRQEAVDVDVSGALAKGQAYKVYNVLDIKGPLRNVKPVVTGVCDGKPVSFPMLRSEVSPDFDAFLVLPGK